MSFKLMHCGCFGMYLNLAMASLEGVEPPVYPLGECFSV